METTKKEYSEITDLIENSDRCLVPIVAADGRIVGLITDPDICTTAASNNRLFCCEPDEDMRAALKDICSKVEVEVAGGILRHHHSW